MKRLTRDIVIERFTRVHGDRYEYNNVRYINSSTHVSVICKKHGEFGIRPADHFAGKGCPYCSGKKVHIKTCVATLRPDLIRYFKDKEDAYNHTLSSDRHVKAICPECGNEKSNLIQVKKLVKRGFSCDACGDGISTPEKFVYHILTGLNIEFDYQYSPKWIKPKRYDFYIPKFNCILEVDGGMHFRETGLNKSLDEVIANDTHKKNTALDNGILKYINIDCRISEFEHLKSNVSKGLSEITDVNKIDFLNAWTKSQSSMVKMVCDIWNNRKSMFISTEKIANNLNLTRPTIRRYLKIGNELGWCNYDPSKEKYIRGVRAGLKKGKAVIQYTLDGEYINEFYSAQEAQRVIGCTHVSCVCRGERNHAGGYKWIYKEDYEKLINKDLTEAIK